MPFKQRPSLHWTSAPMRLGVIRILDLHGSQGLATRDPEQGIVVAYQLLPALPIATDNWTPGGSSS